MTEGLQSTGLMPVMSVDDAVNRASVLADFKSRVLKRDIDYGLIPGIEGDLLFKPGAEKIASFFGLAARYDVTDRHVDWTGETHGDEPLFSVEHRCILYRGAMVVGEGIGSCNSREKGFRYRTSERVCPLCNKPTIIKGKAEYGGGWICFKKKGGCGEKWPDGTASIEGQTVGQVINPDFGDVVNTITKISAKRAFIDAVIKTTCASDIFSEDTDIPTGDMVTGAEQPKQTEAPATDEQLRRVLELVVSFGVHQEHLRDLMGRMFPEPTQPQMETEISVLESADKLPFTYLSYYGRILAEKRGIKGAEINSYMRGAFGTNDVSKLTREQQGELISWLLGEKEQPVQGPISYYDEWEDFLSALETSVPFMREDIGAWAIETYGRDSDVLVIDLPHDVLSELKGMDIEAIREKIEAFMAASKR
jgi:hypothetical protein